MREIFVFFEIIRQISRHSMSLKSFDIMRIRHFQATYVFIRIKCLRWDSRVILWSRPVIGWQSFCRYLIGWERHLSSNNMKTSHIRMTSSFLIENEWFEVCLTHMILKNTKISFTSKVSYFKDTPVHCIVAWILFPEVALSDGPSFWILQK